MMQQEVSRGFPAIVGVPKRSRFGVMDEDRAYARAIDSMRGIDVQQPILFNGKLIGWAKGKQQSPEVLHRRSLPGERWWCGFTTYDDLINEKTNNGKGYTQSFSKSHSTTGVANNFYDLWPVGGNPASGTYTGAAFTARVLTDADVGAIYHAGNVTPDTKHFTRLDASVSANTPTLFLYDRCLTYEACTFNASVNQAMTNGSTLNRYQNAGEGACKIMCTAQTVLGATGANITQLRYTNQAGTTLQSMPTSPTVSHIVSAAAPTATLGARIVAPATAAGTLPWGPYMPLAAGDGGARLINDYTTSAANTGTLCFVLARQLAVLSLPTAGVTSMIDLVQQIAGLERIRDGACLALMMYQPATTANILSGSFDCAWG
jgi:hypothetical protein